MYNMFVECGAIILLIGVMSLALFRSRSSSGFGVGVLPLILVPVAHIIGGRLSFVLARLLNIQRMTAYIGIDVVALMATCLLLGAVSTQIKRRRTRWLYLILCGGFSALLTCVLLVRGMLM